MKKIVLASGNKGKVKEFQNLFSSYQIDIVPQSDFAVPEIEETGQTFVENAILKARNAAKVLKLPAIADDSGLEVDYLKGEPGIYSARYAGNVTDFSQNIEKLLANLKDVPWPKRIARFKCLLVYLRSENDPSPIICEGTWKGFILEEEKGTQGFGYDPVFWVPELECTAAELPLLEKNKLSHRGKAMHELIQKLKAHDLI